MLKRKDGQQYLTEYRPMVLLKANSTQDSLYVIYCDSSFATEAMKPIRLLDHLKRKHLNKAGKSLEYFKILKENFELCNR